MGNIIPKIGCSVEEEEKIDKCKDIMAELTSLRINKFKLEQDLHNLKCVLSERDEMYENLEGKYNCDLTEHKNMIAEMKTESAKVRNSYEKLKHINVSIVQELQTAKAKKDKNLNKLEKMCSTKLVNDYMKTQNNVLLEDTFERKLLLDFQQFLIDSSN